MNIIVDENVPLADELLGELGDLQKRSGRSLSRSDVKKADALIVRSVTPVNESLLDGSSVAFVGTCTIGTDHVDKSYLAAHDIAFHSAPGCNANSVVEYVFCALTALSIPWWQPQAELTFGIIGCGNVGGALYRQLQRLGITVKVYDPFLSMEQCEHLSSFGDVIATDVICVHTPYTTTGPYPTHHLLNHEVLLQLKPGAVLLNAGRGGVIDNAALHRVLAQRSDLKVVLDVWEHEPQIMVELMHQVDIATPHIAGYSVDGKARGTYMIYERLCEHFGLPIRHSLPPLLGQLKEQTPQARNALITPDFSGNSMAEGHLGAVMKCVYDISEDDRRFRQAMTAVAQEGVDQHGNKTLVAAFDRLRKHYPPRFEFSNFSLAELPVCRALFDKGGEQFKTPLLHIGFTP
ncbi:4-phosphoerythronate dehydrogenase [Marinibactrum halimedae]|uniref:Erythronate-4-phosphate dehydrogenase n=1 Tax=Marinibactrum halimedae TaxID=1444977 RepID=A0AA37T7R7_9GAMM|nr:4-phosphoerythronate dehydrogenase [Marinibactrum halimedae]MCD9457852.1 4-phosphoerythronate dehydrogenase [Marinibactrum halimedae]GLS26327.1 erythronate-4-phosphate dehydrogenase [Marinibactrum halimedae]